MAWTAMRTTARKTAAIAARFRGVWKGPGRVPAFLLGAPWQQNGSRIEEKEARRQRCPHQGRQVGAGEAQPGCDQDEHGPDNERSAANPHGPGSSRE